MDSEGPARHPIFGEATLDTRSSIVVKSLPDRGLGMASRALD